MSETSYAFGPYTLSARRRMLMDGQRPVPLGSRAIDILLVLVERAGEVVGKNELIARAWPDTHVDESNLRVHIAALRKAFGDGRSVARYVLNVPGRGYAFMAPVTRIAESTPRTSPASVRNRYLPVPLTRTVGRAGDVTSIADRLSQGRLVSIVGPGGIGKTTVAAAAAGFLDDSFAEPARFVDLSSVSQPRTLSAAVAAALGFPIRAGDAVAGLVDGLRDRQMLIVLDNCEHVLDEATSIVEATLRGAPGLRLLTTSREPLRAEGEWIHRLSPLGVPPAGVPVDARNALGYPAVELFAERAAARLGGFELSDADAETVAEICRRLDGIPLAIEFAAAMVDVFGVHELAKRLHDQFAVLIRGRRTALPRHQTLRATLDWSYSILAPREQAVLRRLAVFRGRFTAAEAAAVAASSDINPAETAVVLLDLVAKSLVIADLGGTVETYRLLYATRAYGQEKLAESGERREVEHRHAEHLLTFLRDSDVDGEAWSPSEWRDTFGRLIDDIRTALDWAFSRAGDAALGVRLSVASAPVWFRLSLMGEFLGRVTMALDNLDAGWPDATALEMRLAEALGHAKWHVAGPGIEMSAAFRRALEIAERLEDCKCQMQALWGLWIERNVFGDYCAAAQLAEKHELVAHAAGGSDPDLIVSERMLALSCHAIGQQAKARQHAERLLARTQTNLHAAPSGAFQFDLRVGTRAVLSRVLWIQGFPDQALQVAQSAVDAGFELGHTLSQCFALHSAYMVAIWTGDRAAAATYAALLIDYAAKHSLIFWQAWGRSCEIALTLTEPSRDRQIASDPGDWRNPMCGALLPELMATISEDLVDDGLLARIEADSGNWCASEVLRAQGERLLQDSPTSADESAEAMFLRASEVARQQGALSWELRAATSFARLRQRQRRPLEAMEVLAAVLARFSEGHETSDVVKARSLRAKLERTVRTA